MTRTARGDGANCQTAARRRAASRAIAAALLVLAIGCAGRQPRQGRPAARPGTFVATAYCQGTITASGARVRVGFVAADPAVLPLGTVIRVSGLERRYNRTYRVMDTGGAIQGRRIDLYMRSCDEAIRFGRRPAVVSVVSRGSGSGR